MIMALHNLQLTIFSLWKWFQVSVRARFWRNSFTLVLLSERHAVPSLTNQTSKYNPKCHNKRSEKKKLLSIKVMIDHHCHFCVPIPNLDHFLICKKIFTGILRVFQHDLTMLIYIVTHFNIFNMCMLALYAIHFCFKALIHMYSFWCKNTTRFIGNRQCL